MSGVELLITPATIPFDQAIAEDLVQVGKGRAGFEAAHLSVKRYRELRRQGGEDRARL